MNSPSQSTKPANVTLDDESLLMLLDEVCAMAASGRSLVPALADLDDASMGKLGRAATAVRASLARGRSAAESIAELSMHYSTPIRIAMEVMAKTGSTKPIREAVRLIREANEDRRQLRLSSINPILNVIVAATVAFFVIPWMLVSLSEAELIKSTNSPTDSEILNRFAQNFALAATATVVLLAILLFGLFRVLSRVSGDAAALRGHATLCRWLAIQIRPPIRSQPQGSGNLETGRILEAAVAVTGPPLKDAWAGVIERIAAGAKSADALAFPAETPEPVCRCILDMVAGNRDAESIAFDLQSLGRLYSQRSRRKREWWIDVLPRWVSWALLIAIIVILLRAILMPLLHGVGEVAL